MFHLHSEIPLFHRFNKIGNGTLVLLFQTTKCIILVVVIDTILHQKVDFIPMFYIIHFQNIYVALILIGPNPTAHVKFTWQLRVRFLGLKN